MATEINSTANVNSENTDMHVSKKKLIRGKCTKPDESDIKVVVKYTHEKLNTRQVKDRKFDSLEFNVLIAGDLDFALLPHVSVPE